jgi:hypothetical protein
VTGKLLSEMNNWLSRPHDASAAERRGASPCDGPHNVVRMKRRVWELVRQQIGGDVGGVYKTGFC